MGGSNKKSYLSGTRSSEGQPATKGSGKGTGAGGGSSSGGSDHCNIRSAGTLRSPSPAIIPHLTTGALLDVQVVRVAGLDVLQANHGARGPVGVIDCPDEQALVDCIAIGNIYQAQVSRISGGAVSVIVTRI